MFGRLRSYLTSSRDIRMKHFKMSITDEDKSYLINANHSSTSEFRHRLHFSFLKRQNSCNNHTSYNVYQFLFCSIKRSGFTEVLKHHVKLVGNLSTESYFLDIEVSKDFEKNFIWQKQTGSLQNRFY